MTGAPAAHGILIAASEVDERVLGCLASGKATFVRTVEEVQRALREQVFRLIVIDLNFDALATFDLLEHVRAFARRNSVPVLCVPGSGGDAGIAEGLDRVARLLRGMGRSQPRATGTVREPDRRRSLCVLVIDQDVDAAHRLGERIERHGHEVDLAYDASAAIEAARHLRPDAAFLRVAPASWDADALARRLRSQPGVDGLFVVAVSSASCALGARGVFDAHLGAADDASISRMLDECRSRITAG